MVSSNSSSAWTPTASCGAPRRSFRSRNWYILQTRQRMRCGTLMNTRKVGLRNSMDVLVVGGGGREHALAWKLKQSPRIQNIYIAPGNGGTGNVGENVPIAVTDFEQLTNFVKEKNIALTIVGPDDPLALGIVDFFKERGLRIWGPSKAAAEIEASKAFSKQLMAEAGIPTPH